MLEVTQVDAMSCFSVFCCVHNFDVHPWGSKIVILSKISVCVPQEFATNAKYICTHMQMITHIYIHMHTYANNNPYKYGLLVGYSV